MFGVEPSGSAVNPVNKDEHEALGVIMGKKLAKQSESYHFVTLMKAMFKEGLVDVKSDIIKELASNLNVMSSEKQKAEKAAQGGKKKKNVKKTLAKDYDAFDDIGLSTQGNGDSVGFDDGDFM